MLFSQIVQLVDVAAWPVVALVVFIRLRKPIAGLLKGVWLNRLKIKGVEAEFQRESEDVLASLPQQDIEPEAARKQSVDEPRQAVLDAWGRVEKAARRKYHELADAYPSRTRTYAPGVRYFQESRVLVPSTTAALIDLHGLRNRAVHALPEEINADGARAYLDAADVVRKQIEAVDSLPSMDLRLLTLLILQYNAAVDTGKYGEMGVEGVYEAIRQDRVLQYVKDGVGSDIDLSLHLNRTDDFERQYNARLKAQYEGGGDLSRKWGVENLGLCLLIAWTNEIVQNGSGWYPDDNVAGL